jgi:RNA polymerase sigma-70 factor (ECF subfamily)
MLVDAPPAPPASGRALATDVAAWLDGARRGERAAFEALYRAFAPVAHGIALSRVGPSDADDVVQETFLAVHRSLATLRQAAAFPGWLASVARNAALDRLRRRRRDPVPLHDVPARGDRPGDGELRARVFVCLQDLPEAYRETLVWRLVEGLSGPEIAERTGMTPASVRVNLHRGMTFLRERLGREGIR